MKVLHVYKDLAPLSTGGVEELIRSLSRGLAARGIESDAVGTRSGPLLECAETHTGLTYYPRTLNMLSCPLSFSMFKAFPEKVKPYDLLHYHFPWPFADLLHLVHRVKKPYIITYHADIVKQKFLQGPYNPLMKRFFSGAKYIVTTSENLKYSSPCLENYQDKVLIAPYGADLSQYPTPTPESLNYWKHRVGENFFLFVGVLRYYKGLHYLLDAASDLPFQIVIAGKGPLEKELKQRIQAENLSNVHMLGYVSELEKTSLIQLSRAVIAPSHLRSEAFCISLLEGLIHGKPLISTELDTGTSFVNTHNVSGIVVPPASPSHLKEAMFKLSEDQSFYEKMSQGTQAHYRKHFTQNQMLNTYQKIYEACSLS